MMHPSEETEAVLGLFDGEIRFSERETAKDTEKVFKIRKLLQSEIPRKRYSSDQEKAI